MLKTGGSRPHSSHGTTVSNVTPNVAEPSTVPADKLSSVSMSGGDQFRSLNTIANMVFGTELAPGVIVTKASGRAKLHIIDVPLSRTLSNPNATSSKLLETIQSSQEVLGNTPSLKALRVMFLILSQDTSIPAEDKAKLKELKRELEAIDLNKPKDPSWIKECQIELKGQRSNINISLQYVNPITRALARLFSSEMDKTDRYSKYNFKVEISLAEKNKSALQTKLEARIHQIKAVGLLLSPMIGAVFLRATLLPTNLVPKIFSNGGAQSFLEFCSELAPIALAGAVSHYVLQKWQRIKSQQNAI